MLEWKIILVYVLVASVLLCALLALALWRKTSKGLLLAYAYLGGAIFCILHLLSDILELDLQNEVALLTEAFSVALAISGTLMFVTLIIGNGSPRPLLAEQRSIPIAAAMLSFVVVAVLIYVVPLLYINKSNQGTEAAMLLPWRPVTIGFAIAVAISPKLWLRWLKNVAGKLAQTSDP